VKGFSNWSEVLGIELALILEVNFPPPPGYRRWFKNHLDDRILIPYLRETATMRGNRREARPSRRHAGSKTGVTGV
jgi:hypothetical protein